MEKDKETMLTEAMNHEYSTLLRTAQSYVKDVMIAEDMVQEAFLKAYEKFDSFQQGNSLRAWIFRIMINQCKDHLRSYTCRKVAPWEDQWLHAVQADQQNPLSIMVEKEDYDSIHEAIGLLQPDYHEAVQLYYFRELSVKQMSLALHMNENTLKTRMKRARDHLGQRLENHKERVYSA
ncbi:sigma-70 family RNA polymerase sigma factor [Halobacillus naozhouensis]|uniref:Sigma-70 family RNA polymerase sigma factor n=1 Tax=Halobacillus naozhouensis TaxID=554880 RepID=A0ABY8J329_9BACI|nr:sigma-70 family RNA polymerase sigma factor [Halobacillus naozhouensis]WFT75170.1 sigma-70 family RNA polymerase sigma factor [Halobacillus naozhouensis]